MRGNFPHIPQPDALAEIYARSPFPTCLLDGATRVVLSANPAFAELLSYSPVELHGIDLDALVLAPEEDEEPGIEPIADILASGDAGPRHTRFRSRDGDPVDLEIRAVPVSVAGSPRVAIYARDVREERQAERDRIRLQSQLWGAQKHEAVGRLAAGIAHDFNNLLSTVMLTSESLRTRLGPMEWGTRADLDAIVDAGLKARNLTRELLAFSGRQMLQPRAVSMNQVLEEMQELLRRTLPADIDLVVRPCAQPAAVHADPAQMQQVLLNLVVNARDAMPAGGDLLVQVHEVELDADFAREYVTVQPGPHVMLSVTDTGVGMDPETQARIFEPFFTTRERGDGQGLGLATVYGIVKQSGGSIWVTSEPGVGTTFRIYLPRVAAAELPADIGSEETEGDVVGGSEHVMVVEDEESVLQTTARILRELGYMVSEATGPQIALQVLDRSLTLDSSRPVDLVLTDIVMPGMSGVELARKLHERRNDLPVLYMTGYQDPGGDEDSGGEPVRPVIPKPFTRAELARTVRDVLGG